MTRRYTRGRNVALARSIAELQHMARRRLPAFAFEYLDGGAEDESSLARNREVFSELEFLPLALVQAGASDASTQIFGQPASLPLLIAPMGFCALFARDADLCLARAAAAAGVPYIQSTVSNAALEDFAAIPGLRHWFQLYVFRSRAITERLLARALAAGCEALLLTTDGPVIGNREWDMRNYRQGMEPSLRNKLDIALHPRWIWDVFGRGLPGFGNLREFLPAGERDLGSTAAWSRRELDPDLDWALLAWLRANWPRKLVLKGLLSVDDALRARDAGVDAIVLSNHGGRQLDGAVSPLTVLPEIAGRLGGDMSILIDSGFRRGTDVVKALALGADAVLLGRAALYGLAAGGERGVARALAIIAEEIVRSLALLGRPRLGLLDASCLLRPRPP